MFKRALNPNPKPLNPKPQTLKTELSFRLAVAVQALEFPGFWGLVRCLCSVLGLTSPREIKGLKFQVTTRLEEPKKFKVGYGGTKVRGLRSGG